MRPEGPNFEARNASCGRKCRLVALSILDAWGFWLRLNEVGNIHRYSNNDTASGACGRRWTTVANYTPGLPGRIASPHDDGRPDWINVQRQTARQLAGHINQALIGDLVGLNSSQRAINCCKATPNYF